MTRRLLPLIIDNFDLLILCDTTNAHVHSITALDPVSGYDVRLSYIPLNWYPKIKAAIKEVM